MTMEILILILSITLFWSLLRYNRNRLKRKHILRQEYLCDTMIKLLESAVDKKYKYQDSICRLYATDRSEMLLFLWRELFNGCIEETFARLGYRDREYPIEESWFKYLVVEQEGTHWTHPEYGPKRIDLAKKLLVILKEKRIELTEELNND